MRSQDIRDHEARIAEDIRARGFDAVAARHASAHPNVRKYLDLNVWVPKNLRRARDLALDIGPKRRVLDLGCGSGYFLYLCKLLGHEVLGVDLPDEPMYRELTAMLEVPVLHRRIEPMTSLDCGRFDVVTAFMITFNGHCERPWGVDEWAFFLDSFDAPLVYLELNREPNGTVYPPGVRELFEARGAQIDEHRVTLIDRSRGR